MCVGMLHLCVQQTHMWVCYTSNNFSEKFTCKTDARILFLVESYTIKADIIKYYNKSIDIL